jgi:hypothetical protein
MKYSTLRSLVKKYAEEQKSEAEYSGGMNNWNSDGGAAATLAKLADFKNSLVVKMDLRPSEFKKLDTLDVGEPPQFNTIIMEEKQRLAKNIVL